MAVATNTMRRMARALSLRRTPSSSPRHPTDTRVSDELKKSKSPATVMTMAHAKLHLKRKEKVSESCNRSRIERLRNECEKMKRGKERGFKLSTKETKVVKHWQKLKDLFDFHLWSKYFC